jgi:hypothetical protein
MFTLSSNNSLLRIVPLGTVQTISPLPKTVAVSNPVTLTNSGYQTYMSISLNNVTYNVPITVQTSQNPSSPSGTTATSAGSGLLTVATPQPGAPTPARPGAPTPTLPGAPTPTLPVTQPVTQPGAPTQTQPVTQPVTQHVGQITTAKSGLPNANIVPASQNTPTLILSQLSSIPVLQVNTNRQSAGSVTTTTGIPISKNTLSQVTPVYTNTSTSTYLVANYNGQTLALPVTINVSTVASTSNQSTYLVSVAGVSNIST